MLKKEKKSKENTCKIHRIDRDVVGFATYDRRILKNQKLSVYAKTLLIRLIDNNAEKWVMNVGYLFKELGISPHHGKRAKKELIENGFLSMTRNKSGSWHYEVYETLELRPDPTLF